MKKLSLIAGLACLATIGGVFGVWTFGSDAEITASEEKQVTITVVEDYVDYGAQMTAEIQSDISFTVDQAANHPNGEGTFLNAAGAITVNVTDIGVENDEWELTAVATWKLEGVEYYAAVDGGSVSKEAISELDDEAVEFTFSAAEMLAKLSVSGVDSVTKLDELKAITTLPVTVTITRTIK